MVPVTPLVQLASKVVVGPAMFSDPMSSITQMPSSTQGASTMLAAQSFASAQSADTSFQAADDFIEGYGRKRDEDEREILRLRGVVTHLRHRHLVHKGAKVMKIRADQLKRKRPVCFVNDLSYRYKTIDAYMHIMNTIYRYLFISLANNDEGGRRSSVQAPPHDD